MVRNYYAKIIRHKRSITDKDIIQYNKVNDKLNDEYFDRLVIDVMGQRENQIIRTYQPIINRRQTLFLLHIFFKKYIHYFIIFCIVSAIYLSIGAFIFIKAIFKN